MKHVEVFPNSRFPLVQRIESILSKRRHRPEMSVPAMGPHYNDNNLLTAHCQWSPVALPVSGQTLTELGEGPPEIQC